MTQDTNTNTASGAAYAALPDDRESFKTYLKECDECAIVPDVAGAFNAAWQIASHGQAHPTVDDLCARIKAADDAAADRDYMLDSNDCIAVLRGEWKAPLAMDKPERPSHGQAPAGATLPEGWVPLVITHEGQSPEEIAYGPQRMMDRLGKWLRKYFDSVVAAKAQPAPAAVAGPVVNRATVIEWLDANDIEVTDRQMDGLFHFAAPTDDAAVDALAAHMKAKLAKQRAKGYGGWDDPGCSQQRLSDMLRDHVAKGDPVDVANFCAFLTARGEGIAPPAPQQEAQDPHGWLYDWTHSSATGKPDTTYTGFTKDEAHARKNDNCRAVYTAPQPLPASQGDALDTVRLDWLLWKLPGDAIRYVVGELADTADAAEFRAAIDAARKEKS